MQNLYIKSLDISGTVPDLTAGRYINQPRRQRKVQCKKFISFVMKVRGGTSMWFNALNVKKIVAKFPQTTLTLKIANSRSNYISNIIQVFRRFSYVVCCAEYVQNSKKIPADTIALENLYFKVKDTLVIFLVFSPSNHGGKHSEILPSARNEIWPWIPIFTVNNVLRNFKTIFYVFQTSNFA